MFQISNKNRLSIESVDFAASLILVTKSNLFYKQKSNKIETQFKIKTNLYLQLKTQSES
jgi:hypothetical protein